MCTVLLNMLQFSDPTLLQKDRNTLAYRASLLANSLLTVSRCLRYMSAVKPSQITPANYICKPNNNFGIQCFFASRSVSHSIEHFHTHVQTTLYPRRHQLGIVILAHHDGTHNTRVTQTRVSQPAQARLGFSSYIPRYAACLTLL